MSEVFVSYKAEDRARVAPLVEALTAEGLSVWWDAHIGGGEEWRDQIAGHLDAAACVIVVWSKRSTGKDGRFVREEATRALKRGTYLPILIDRVEPPLGFGETQALPLLGWKGDRSHPHYAAIAGAATAMAAGQPHHVPAAPPPLALARRPLLVGGAAAIGLAGIGGWLLLKPSGAKANSIAVLPFANLSGDPRQDYFSDGMAEELRSALSRIAGLKVVARTSSEMLRDADAKTAADKLGVENIVAGSVRRSPGTIRINAQLIDGDDGLERWSQAFDRPAGNVLAIQSEIAENVARTLRIELGGADRRALTLGGTRNAEARDLVLRSIEARRDDSEPSLRRALSLVDEAIALDPTYAEAEARRALILIYLASVHAQSADGARREAQLALQSAHRAIAIAPRFAMGHAALSNVLRDRLQMRGALREAETAYSLRGTDAPTLYNYTYLLMQAGRSDEARTMTHRIMDVDPLNPATFEVQTVTAYYARRYQDALASGRRGLEMAPDRIRMRAFVANALLQLGRTDSAAREFARMPSGDYRRLTGEAVIAARSGRRSAAHAAREELRDLYGDAIHWQNGQIYAQLGMPDEAFKELDAAWAVRDAGFGYLRVDPFVDPLRKDPRFAAAEARLNFPPG